MIINFLIKIVIGVVIFVVMLFIIAFTTRDITRVTGYSGSIKSGNCSRMFVRSVTFLLAEVDAYLIILKDMPILKTIVLLPHSEKKDIDWANDDTSFGLFLLTLLVTSIFSVYFMTSLGWL